MYCLVCLISLLATSFEDEPGGTPSATAPRISVQVEAGPYFVGQGIVVDLSYPRVETEALDPVESPSVSGAELITIQPARAGRARYCLVPTRAGRLTIPPFRIKRASRMISSRPTTIEVTNVPLTGRSAAFLGGVGTFTVKSSVEPATVRLGQMVDYQIKLSGPAAWSTQRLPPLALGPEIEIRQAKLDRAATDPPCVTFRYQLRVMKPGTLVLKPVAMAAFNPDSGSYATRYCESQTLTVEAPRSFDSSQVSFAPVPAPSFVERQKLIRWGGGTVVAGVVIWVWRCRGRIRRWMIVWRTNQPVRWGREASRLKTAVRDRDEIHLVAAEITTRLGRLLAQISGRPVAVLTPLEAVAMIDQLTNNRNLADRTGRLISRLDQIRFDPETQATAGDRRELVAEAVVVFRSIGER